MGKTHAYRDLVVKPGNNRPHGGPRIKLKVKFSLEQATKTQRGSRGIALLFL
jgi:hypothetical protein